MSSSRKEERCCASMPTRDRVRDLMKLPTDKRIYIDFDDVLCETALAFTHIVRAEFGRAVHFDDILSFNLWESFSLSQEEYERLMALGHEDTFLAALKPLPGVRQVLQEWVAAGFQISVVTGRPPSCVQVSRDWLRQHDFPVHDTVFVDKYGRNPAGDGSVSPGQLAHMDFALAIEDAPAMASFIRDHTAFPLVVYDRPWNRSFLTGDASPTAGNATRAMSWTDIGARWRAWLGVSD
ncbi:MAG: hypothetical protein O3C57_05980 [Verrucomicrobia bacterium]|nr:hypothetical protein [Verrucomicrobiota bacterium]